LQAIRENEPAPRLSRYDVGAPEARPVVIGGAFSGLGSALRDALPHPSLESIGFVFSGNSRLRTSFGARARSETVRHRLLVFIWPSESVSAVVGALAALLAGFVIVVLFRGESSRRGAF